MTRDQLLGVWKLISYEFRLHDGITIRPMGVGVQGILIYEPNGYMALHIFDPERPKFAKEDWMLSTPEEAKSALDGCIAYYGVFEVDAAKSSVMHHILGCTFPNWIGVERTQTLEITRDQLTLTMPPMSLGGERIIGQLVFKKVGNRT